MFEGSFFMFDFISCLREPDHHCLTFGFGFIYDVGTRFKSGGEHAHKRKVDVIPSEDLDMKFPVRQ